jgi:hypothetical protein
MAVLVSGCSGEDPESTAAPSSDAQPTAQVSKPTYTKFADWPGEELVYTKVGEELGARVKPIDTMWTPELAGVSADADKHFFAAYFAVTGELPDRGVDNLSLSDLQLRFKTTAGTCNERTWPVDGEEYCFATAYPNGKLEVVADGEWRKTSWTKLSVMGTPIPRGATMIGVVGFAIPDTVEADTFELCGPSKERPSGVSTYPCVPVKAPAEPRG